MPEPAARASRTDSRFDTRLRRLAFSDVPWEVPAVALVVALVVAMVLLVT